MAVTVVPSFSQSQRISTSLEPGNQDFLPYPDKSDNETVLERKDIRDTFARASCFIFGECLHVCDLVSRVFLRLYGR